MPNSTILKHLALAVGIMGLVSLLTQVGAKPSQAAIVNGDFETGDFTGWSTLGTTSIITSVFGGGTAEGISYALLKNNSDIEDTEITDSAIESFLGLEFSSLDALIKGNATQGSVIQQSFTAQAGEILRFDWNFLTNENTPGSDLEFNDFAFFSINDVAFKLADTFSTFRELPLSSSFWKETGLGTYSYTFTADGTYTLGFGVLQERDAAVASALVVDNVKLYSESQEIPEPMSGLGLSALGTLVAGSILKRKQQQN